MECAEGKAEMLHEHESRARVRVTPRVLEARVVLRGGSLELGESRVEV
jgi:hypothetical protein